MQFFSKKALGAVPKQLKVTDGRGATTGGKDACLHVNQALLRAAPLVFFLALHRKVVEPLDEQHVSTEKLAEQRNA
jgi:hypothetical protein